MMDDDDCVPQLVDDDQVATAVAAAAAAAASAAAVQPATTAPVVTAKPPVGAPGYVRDPNDPPVPLTILTGWLGSGKTTLLTRILTHFSSRGLQLAIVQNEASSFGVEAGLRVANSSTGEDGGVFSDMLEFSNGCVCCAIKSDFVLGVEALLARKRFDYIVLECSGLADPGPLAQMFWVDPELESSVYLDGIVSVVDAKNFLGHLRPPNGNNGGDAGSLEAQQVIHQVAYADRVLLNKLDLVGTDERDECEREIRRINQSAPILTSVRSDVDLDQLLHIHAFDVNDTTRAVIMPPLEALSPDQGQEQTSGSSDAAPVVAAHPHDDSIRTFMVDDLAVPPAQRRAVSLPALKKWMGDLLWRDAIDSEEPDDAGASADDAGSAAVATGGAAAASSGNAAAAAATAAAAAAAALAIRPNCLFRVKAIMRLEGQNTPTFLQAVQALYDIQPGTDWPTDGPAATAATVAGGAVVDAAAAARFTRFVFIGRRLDHDNLRQGFDSIFVQ